MNYPCLRSKVAFVAKVSILLTCVFLLQSSAVPSAIWAKQVADPIAPEDIKPQPPVPKAFLGIFMSDAGDDSGVKVQRVVFKSPAQLAGLKVNDIVVKFGNEQVKNVDQIRAQIKKYSVGESVVVTLKRGGVESKVELELGDSVTQSSVVKPDIVSRSFGAADGLQVTADLYLLEGFEPTTPLIVLCHQAGYSRGEYREIAPRLNKLGFNCIAIDQRSGGTVNQVSNLTHMKAVAQSKTANFVTAEQDVIAAVKWAKANHGTGKVLLWGSSYSAALAIRIAGENPDLVDGVLAFAPGEYFQKFDKPKDWIATSAKKISVPVFVTSAKNEAKNWAAIFEAIPGESKTKFIPETAGNHGSSALWKKFPGFLGSLSKRRLLELPLPVQVR